MRCVLKVLIVATAVAVISAPAMARAEGYVSPWVSANTGSSFDNGRAGFGVDAGGMGAGIIECDVTFTKDRELVCRHSQCDLHTTTNILTVPELAAIVGVPVGGTHGGGVRPFATAGIGLIRTQIDGGTIATVSSSNNMLGWNAGAGVMGFFNDHVGLRGDIKYLRGFEDTNTGVNVIDLNAPGQLHFWRAAVGVVLR